MDTSLRVRSLEGLRVPRQLAGMFEVAHAARATRRGRWLAAALAWLHRRGWLATPWLQDAWERQIPLPKDVNDAIRAQVEVMWRRRLTPSAILVGPAQLNLLRGEATMPAWLEVRGTAEGVLGRQIAVDEWAIEASGRGRAERNPLGIALDDLKAEGYRTIRLQHDPARRVVRARGTTVFGIPVFMLPWIDGVLVVPQFDRTPTFE